MDVESLREYCLAKSAVQTGYHMNKKHWNTVTADGTIPSRILKEMIDDSYRLIVNSLPKNLRDQL